MPEVRHPQARTWVLWHRHDNGTLMGEVNINRHNVGRIAERIVSNELESRGFRVSDLNKKGTSANADLLAAKDGKTWQIQVKGASEGGSSWWVNYGFGYQEVIDRQTTMYNSVESFYRAQVVILVSVKSARDYRCVIMPVEEAEKAAQTNLDHSFRNPKRRRNPARSGPILNTIRRCGINRVCRY